MPPHGNILGRAQDSQDFSTTGIDYTLTTYLEVSKATGQDKSVLGSVRWVEARFSLKEAGAIKGRNVGHVYALEVDKTVLKAGAPVWLTEILDEESAHDEKIDELRTALRELYDGGGNVHDQVTNLTQEYRLKAGNVGQQVIDVSADLNGESILFVDTLWLHEDCRGTGLSKVAMQAFHRLLPRITNGHAYTGTVVLSPAASGDFRDSSDKTDAQVEEALIRLYKGVGYEVWVKGDQHVEDSVTVMGIVLADADDGQVDE